MKKVLLGSTALLGLGLLSAEALAQVELTISGNARFEAGWASEDNDTGADRDYDFRQDGVLQFNADAVTDNGLEYGAEIEFDDIDATGSDSGDGDDVEVDEQYVYVGGGFGEVRLGDKEAASVTLAVTAPTTGSGGFDGNYGQYMIGGAGSYLLDLDGGDSTRITYISPEFAGFQAGVSYAPSLTEGKEGPTHRTAPTVENAIDIGANYTLDFGGANVLVGAGYTTAEGVDAGDDDRTGYHVGANVGFGGITVGAAYVELTDDGAGGEENTLQLGATYEFGSFVVGASAAFDETEDAAGATDDTDIYAVGGTYSVAPGLSVYGDVAFVDAEATDNEATVFIIGTSVAF